MSLHNSAVLSNLSLKSFAATRTDRSLTDDILLKNGASGNAGRWQTNLLPSHALDPIKKIDSQIRKWHYEQTLPWLDKGPRILTSANFDDYTTRMRGFRQEREGRVKHFLDNYEDYINQAQQMLNGMFDRANYPHPQAAAKGFGMKLDINPLPHHDDFRITLQAEDKSAIEADMEARLEEAKRIATFDLLYRIAEPLQAMANRLSDPDAKFKDSLVGNLRHISELIPKLNVNDDPRMKKLKRVIDDQLYYSPDALRNSKTDRDQAVEKANSILNTMAPWLAES